MFKISFRGLAALAVPPRFRMKWLAGAAAVAAIASVSGAVAAGGTGGGRPGDSFAQYTGYTAEACPIPDVVRADYLDIYYCALGKFTSRPSDFKLLVAGHTTLPAGTLREITATSTLTLPCGTTATMTRFTETANAVISPAGTPNGLGVQSGNIADTCLVAGGATAQPDLQVTGSASTGTPALGSGFSYTFQVKNSGTAAATDVVFTDVIPLELGNPDLGPVVSNFRVTSPLGMDTACVALNFDGQPISIICNLGTLAVGAQVTIQIDVTSTRAAGTVVNTGTVTTTSLDKDLTNNSKGISITVR